MPRYGAVWLEISREGALALTTLPRSGIGLRDVLNADARRLLVCEGPSRAVFPLRQNSFHANVDLERDGSSGALVLGARHPLRLS